MQSSQCDPGGGPEIEGGTKCPSRTVGTIQGVWFEGDGGRFEGFAWTFGLSG